MNIIPRISDKSIEIRWDFSSEASTTAGQADVAAAGRGMLDAVLRVRIPGG